MGGRVIGHGEGGAYEHRHTCIYRVRMGMETYGSMGLA